MPSRSTSTAQVHRLEVEPRVTLLDALRTRLNAITGVKRVCDRGACGACTMIVDGKTIYACSTLAIEAQGKTIRTVESFTQGTVLHPVQQAFCDNDGLMCGFCTPGFVTATVALLEKNPKPTAEQAKRALDGNICRCGTYVRVLEAALSAKGVRVARQQPALPQTPPASSAGRRAAGRAAASRAAAPRRTGPPRNWPPVAERTLLGKSIKRLDGPDKAHGPREVHLRHHPARGCSTARSSARRIRTRA